VPSVDGDRERKPADADSSPEDEFSANEFERGRKRELLDPRAWVEAERRKRGMFQRDLADLDPGPWVSALLADGQAAAFIGAAQGVRVELRDAATLPPTSGHLGPAVEVASEDRFLYGTVVLPIDYRHTGRVAVSTLRVFRFEQELGLYTITSFSGLGRGGDYAWGRISSPGVYLAIGLDADPVILRAAQALYAVRDLLMDCEPETRGKITRAIIDALLLAPCATACVEDASQRGHLIRRAFADGLPALPFDQHVMQASAEELYALADSVAEQLDPPALQLLADLRASELEP
jgi:hypothetical protein